MVMKKVVPKAQVVNSRPSTGGLYMSEKAIELHNKLITERDVALPIHPALAAVPDEVNVQNDFERAVYHHAALSADNQLAELEAASINGYVIKEIEMPSRAFRCYVCHAQAQYRLYKATEEAAITGQKRPDMFSNSLVCEAHARAALFPEPVSVSEPVVVEEQKEEVKTDGDTTDSASAVSTDNAGTEQAGTVEVPESKSDTGQESEASSDTP
jgi:hypothetical protein